MPLPEGFNSWEHFQSTVRIVQNRIVREEFSDITDDDGIATPRASLKQACLIDDNDTAMQVMCRMAFYYFVLRKARDLQPPIYGVPDGSSRVVPTGRPQILLYFQEDFQDVELGYSPITGEISFRLMNETPSTLTEANLQTLANKIKTEFASGNGYVWKKGKDYYSYREPDKGYYLKILARTETEAKTLIGKVLDIQGHSPDWQKLTCSLNNQPASRFPTNPGTEYVLGKTRKKKRVRPIADVRFQYAVVLLQGVMNPVALVDRSGVFREALERVW